MDGSFIIPAENEEMIEWVRAQNPKRKFPDALTINSRDSLETALAKMEARNPSRRLVN